MIQPIRSRILGTTNGSNVVNVDLPQIKPGQIARITHAAVENESGESITLKFGVESQGSFDQIYANQTVADSDAFGVMLNFLLLEGDKFRARVQGSSASGKVTFVVSGELIDNQPEVVTVTEVKQ